MPWVRFRNPPAAEPAPPSEPEPADPPMFEYRGQWHLDGMVVMQVSATTFLIGRDPEHPDLAEVDYLKQAEAFESNFPTAKVIVFNGPIQYMPPMVR